MKKLKYYLSFLIFIALSGCFETYEEGYDLVGRVATIPVFTLSQSAAQPGTSITANYRYYSEHEPVTGLRLVQILNGESSEVDSRSVSGHNLRDSYEGSFTYNVPQLAEGTVITLRLEVITANELSNGRNANLQVETPENL
ncbi:hypothetical protein [Pleomorphovibrio marinus]|uniref:hypothetical protein n=1 Tax=Pleomorphovibrio marinus TaxID=2164132 RepID=UPI000E0C768D|nr:hypothetical protein [Pleomorphovibrio marinus]